MCCFLPRAPAAVLLSAPSPGSIPLPSRPSPVPFPTPLFLLWISPGSRFIFQLLEPTEAAISLVINPAAIGCAPVSMACGGLTAGGDKYPLCLSGLRACVYCSGSGVYSQIRTMGGGGGIAACGSRKIRDMGSESVLPVGDTGLPVTFRWPGDSWITWPVERMEWG